MTANTFGRQVVLPLTNKSGGGVIAGDVVIIDTANAGSFTTTTSAASTALIGVAQETIASNAIGRVLLSGYAALVNVNASVTLGHYGQTHTVAKQAASAGASRQAGTFCQFLTGGTTPDAMVWSTDLGGGSGAPTTADYLVGTAQGGLSSEIVVGATPGGELSGTWASPTVDTTHAGSPHATATENFLASDVTMTNANTFYDGPALTPAAGTYLLMGVITLTHNPAGWLTAKLWDGTSQIGDAPAAYCSTPGGGVALPVFGYAVLSGSQTVKISAASDSTGGIINTTATTNGVANKASHLIAIRIA